MSQCVPNATVSDEASAHQRGHPIPTAPLIGATALTARADAPPSNTGSLNDVDTRRIITACRRAATVAGGSRLPAPPAGWSLSTRRKVDVRGARPDSRPPPETAPRRALAPLAPRAAHGTGLAVQ